jgi:hypothetical protein
LGGTLDPSMSEVTDSFSGAPWSMTSEIDLHVDCEKIVRGQ